MAVTLPRDRVRAPELVGAAGWLNTDRPLSLAALRGKIILLDFWTYCCINCMHVLPDLKRLEEKYPRELVVIGVHSAKFTNERETENIRQAILRYEIVHPVVNDRNFVNWRAYGVRAWPTLMVIDAEGCVVGTVSGEGNYELLDQVISELVAEAKAKGILDESPLGVALERAKARASLLSFPGKILADEAGKRLFIADSNNNRIVIATLDGRVLEIAGSGEVGQDDGPFNRARFNHTQRMALIRDTLYVADTENHLIRKLDLQARSVETLAGTGSQARRSNEAGIGRQVALNSPWDLVWGDGLLYIAMAGPHQIWVMDPASREIGPFAGTGREALEDGLRWEAGFAQPSGITSLGRCLFVADSEVSAIRVIDLETDRVSTLVGLDLFEFGDRDGVAEAVRLQHPLGIHAFNGMLYVADTYNHKIKVLSQTTRSCASVVGTGRPGFADGQPRQFYEPGGLWACNGSLWVADTNNHAIRVVDLGTHEVRTLTLTGL